MNKTHSFKEQRIEWMLISVPKESYSFAINCINNSYFISYRFNKGINAFEDLARKLINLGISENKKIQIIGCISK